jgi:hypothetical protein
MLINLPSFSPKLGENNHGTFLSLALFNQFEYIFAIDFQGFNMFHGNSLTASPGSMGGE